MIVPFFRYAAVLSAYCYGQSPPVHGHRVQSNPDPAKRVLMKFSFAGQRGSRTRATVKIETCPAPADLRAHATAWEWAPVTQESSTSTTCPGIGTAVSICHSAGRSSRL